MNPDWKDAVQRKGDHESAKRVNEATARASEQSGAEGQAAEQAAR